MNEQSLKSKLKKISEKEGIVYNSLLETMFLERILVRISKSKYSEKLIFKGGMCLSQFINLRRGTKDIDFLLREMNSGKENLEVAFKEISKINLKDGFIFSDVVVEKLSVQHKQYPGYRISLNGEFGSIRNKVSIDVGVGDVVLPQIVEVKLLRAGEAIFEDSISLIAYPPEYIFSEKLEAILWLGESNSRMKDYYDCFKLIQEDVLVKDDLAKAIKDTFQARETGIELIPLEFVDHLEKRWNGFIKKEKLEKIELKTIIKTINSYLESNATFVLQAN